MQALFKKLLGPSLRVRRPFARFRRNLRRTDWRSALALLMHESSLVLPYSAEPSIHMHVRSYTQLKRTQEKEPETVAWLRSHIKAGDVFYDVGANIGQYSLLAEKLGARVFAFEPSGITFGELAHNIILNNSTITPLPLALSESRSLRYFNLSTDEPGASNHTLSPSRGVRAQGVLSFPLDELVRLFSLPAPTHMKIDVDGGEAELLAGARDTLAKLSSLEIEVSEQYGKSDTVYRILDPLFTLVGKYPRNALGAYNCIYERRSDRGTSIG